MDKFQKKIDKYIENIFEIAPLCDKETQNKLRFFSLELFKCSDLLNNIEKDNKKEVAKKIFKKIDNIIFNLKNEIYTYNK